MPTFETVFSPSLLPLYDLEGKVVIVTDILRATSCMVAGFDNGVEEIVPVLQPDDCQPYADKGYLRAGERGGQKIAGFDLGNSPFDYKSEEVKGKSIVVTTTNGTRALHAAVDAGAKQTLVGAFANLKAIAKYLKDNPDDVAVLCAGWKNRYCLEDALFAGGLAHLLANSHSLDCDSSTSAMQLFVQYEDNLIAALEQTNHARRLRGLGQADRDLEYCSHVGQSTSIPCFEENRLQVLSF